MTKRRLRIDRINRQILIELQKNARISNIDLAEKVALSPSACLKRTKALEDSGYIRNYVMAVNLDKVCHNVQAYLEITLQDHAPQTIDRFQRYVIAKTEFLDCLRVSGGFDYIAFVVTATVPQMNELANSLLAEDFKVQRVNTRMILDSPKWFAGYPLESLKWIDKL